MKLSDAQDLKEDGNFLLLNPWSSQADQVRKQPWGFCTEKSQSPGDHWLVFLRAGLAGSWHCHPLQLSFILRDFHSLIGQGCPRQLTRANHLLHNTARPATTFSLRTKAEHQIPILPIRQTGRGSPNEANDQNRLDKTKGQSQVRWRRQIRLVQREKTTEKEIPKFLKEI